MNNFEEEQNEFDSNIFIKPLDTLNFNEYENSMSFMNESDINKLFSSPNKKGISFFEHNSSNLNNNNYTFYNKNLNNSALNNRINNRYIMNDENDSNYMNIFNKDKKDIYSKNNFNKTYIKKIIGKELFIKPKINNLKNLISPENLNRYYSSFCHSNNYTLESNGLEIKKNSIKIFKNDNNAKSKQLFKDLKLNENIIHIDIIKNKKYTKIFKNQNSCINKINIDIDLNLFTINQIENKRRALNINNNLKTPSDRNLNYNKNEFSYNENKKDETNDMTLFNTDERKNNFSNNLIYNSFKNQSEDYFSKLFITNDFSNSKISTNKYTNDSLKKKREEGITTTPFILDENDIIINDHKNSSHKKAINLKRKHKRNRSRNLINRNNILFFNSVKIYNNNSSFDNDDNEYICKMNNNMSLNSFKGDNDKSNSDKNLEKTDDANNYLNNINRIEINNKANNQNNINEKENKIIFIDKKDSNILLENKKLFISQNSYEELIQEYISKTKDIKGKLINISNKDKKYNLINKDKLLVDKNQKDIDNKISSFENELKLLKNYYLCLLVKKHFLKNKSEKIKLIKDMNIKEKRDMFKISYLNVINFIQEKFKFDYNNLEIYINKIINIIEKYKNITKYDIKYTKKIYKEEKELSPYTLDIKENPKSKDRNIFQKLFKDDLNTKKIIISTSIILPILCGINFFMSFYSNK